MIEFFIHPYFKTKNREKSNNVFGFPNELPELNTIQDINNLLEYLIGNGFGDYDGNYDGESGNQDGDIAGDIAENQDGNQVENQAKKQIGDKAGDIAGNIAGNIAEAINKLVSAKDAGLLVFCKDGRKKENIFNYLKISRQSKNFTSHLKPLIQLGWLALTEPDKPSSPNQKYLTTPKGKLLLKLLKKQ